MMNKPALNELIDKVGCRYMLVTAVSRRARQLMDNPEILGDRKPVSLAVEELSEGRITLEYPEEYLLNKKR